MKKIFYFVSGNSDKIFEVKNFFSKSPIIIKNVALELEEIQSFNAYEVLKFKTFNAWNKIKKPIIIDDTGFYIEKYKYFPGTVTKLVNETIGISGLLKLVHHNDLCYFQTLVAYYDGLIYKSFSGRVEGYIKSHSLANNPKRISDIFFTKSGSLLYNENNLTHRKIAFGKLKKYLLEREEV